PGRPPGGRRPRPPARGGGRDLGDGAVRVAARLAPPGLPRGAQAAALSRAGARRPPVARRHHAATRLAAMALHKRVPENESETELSINPVYYREESDAIPRYRLAEHGTLPRT